MLSSEFALFETELAVVAKLYSKTLEDDLVQIYWSALKDIPFELFKAILRSYIKRGKFFPKPAELRPAGDKETIQVSHDARKSVHIALMELAEKDPKNNGHLKQALATNARNWLEHLETCGQPAKDAYAKARLSSDLQCMDSGSPEYAQALADGPQPLNLESVRKVLQATIKRCNT